MTDQILTGTEAEIVAVKYGVYHNLIARTVGQKPSKRGNVLTRSAVGPGHFIILTKDYDENLRWVAVVGPKALIIGIGYATSLWDKHRGGNESRKIEILNSAYDGQS